MFVRVQYFTENICSCSFVFDTLEKIRVRVRSCSVFSRNIRVRVLFAFMFVFGIMGFAKKFPIFGHFSYLTLKK